MSARTSAARIPRSATNPSTRSIEHRRGPIDADDGHAGAGHGHEHAAGAAAELEHRAADLIGEPPPERDVAPPQRAGVLPVVEGRVGVPALDTVKGR